MSSPKISSINRNRLSIQTDAKQSMPISLDEYRKIRKLKKSRLDCTLPSKLNFSDDSINLNDENISINESRLKNPVAHILKSYREKIRENAKIKRDNVLCNQEICYLKEQLKIANQTILTKKEQSQSKLKLNSVIEKGMSSLSSELDFDEVAEAFLLGLEMKKECSDYVKIEGLVRRARETIQDLKLEMEEWKMVYNKFESENGTLRRALSEINSSKKAYNSMHQSLCYSKGI